MPNHPHRSLSTHLLTLSAVFIFLLSACTYADQVAIETQAAKLAATAAAEAARVGATQLVSVKDTAVALAATEAAKIRLTVEAVLPGDPGDPSQLDAEVLAARQQLKLMPAMTNPWTQIDAPIKNSPGQRSPRRYANVIDQFDVAAADFAGRYQSGGAGNADTRCNIFAGDVMRAMGVPLPTKGDLGKGAGAPSSKYTDPMTANAAQLNDFLNKRINWKVSEKEPGITSDWIEIDPTTAEGLQRLITHVNEGKPAVVSDAGHIAVIRPGQKEVTRWQDLIIAQAGASNFLSGKIEGHFYGTPQFFIKE